MNDKEYAAFKEYKEYLLKYLLSKVFVKPLILEIDNVNVKDRMEEVFKYDIQEFAKYNEEALFMMNEPKLKVFKICTSSEYENLSEIIKNNSNKFNRSITC